VLSCETQSNAANYALYVGEVLAVTLWIIVGVFAITVLGFVCSWVIRARGGLEAGHVLDTRKPGPADDEEASRIHRVRHGSG
jgi:hypothetical protein